MNLVQIAIGQRSDVTARLADCLVYAHVLAEYVVLTCIPRPHCSILNVMLPWLVTRHTLVWQGTKFADFFLCPVTDILAMVAPIRRRTRVRVESSEARALLCRATSALKKLDCTQRAQTSAKASNLNQK